MRTHPLATVTLACALAGCFSKPRFSPGDGGGDGGSDAPTDAGTRTFTAIAAGYHHACAIDTAAELWCWGRNAEGQVSPASGEPAFGEPIRPDASRPGEWTSIAAGASHTCGIHAGTIVCWGNDDYRQVLGSSPHEITLPGGAIPRRVFAGYHGTCALDAADQLWCWGRIDASDPAPLATPTQIMPAGQAAAWAELAIASDHACAAMPSADGGAAYCWGLNESYQLGSTTGARSISTAVELQAAGSVPLNFDQIAVRDAVTCGVTSDRRLMCVGSNANGLFGWAITRGGTTAEPVDIDAGKTWTRVAIGRDHVCAIGDGTVYCYGYNQQGALGDGFDGHLELGAVTLPGGATPVDLVAGEDFTCALDSAGGVSCWGASRFGEHGNGIATARTPQLALTTTGSEQIADLTTGRGHTCAVVKASVTDTTGIVTCWGDNRAKQVDAGEPFAVSPRTSAAALSTISAGDAHTCGVTATNDAYCWGSNARGQLGSPVPTASSHPVTVPQRTMNAVVAGATATCALLSSSTGASNLYCWGDVPGGSAQSTPMMVGDPASAWTNLAIGEGFAFGRLVNNSNVELAGFGDTCALGAANGTAPPLNPLSMTSLQPPATSTFAASQGGYGGGHTCVHVDEQDPTIRCWGNNDRLQINATANAACSTIELVPPPSPFAWAKPARGSLAIADNHSCALAQAGTEAPRVHCWGSNDVGELGIVHQLGPSEVPTQVTDLAVAQVATSATHTCVITDDRKAVYCWGENRYGEVGNGLRFHDRPLPVVIPAM